MTSNNTVKVLCSKDDENFVLKILLIIGGWSSVLTSLLGLLINTFSVIVLANKRMRILSTNIYLMALAVVNCLWLLLFFIFYPLRLTIIIPSYISENETDRYSIYNQIFHRLSPYIIPIMNTLQLCIIYYTVAVSVDRYLFISMGLQNSLYCTVRNAIRIIISLTIFAIVLIFPYWFKFRVITRIDTENRTHYKMSYTNIGQQKLFREIMNLYIYIPIVHVIPYIVLILINILTIRRLIEYHDEHRRLLSTSIRQMAMIKTVTNYSRRHYHVTIMLISIVILFLICRFPMLFTQIHDARDSISDNYMLKNNRLFQCRILHIFNIMATFMQTINSNGNFIIYFFCCQNFRGTSKDILMKLKNFIRLQAHENILTIIRRRSRASTHSTDL